MAKSSEYTRELSEKQIKTLQARYKGYIKRTRRGFLSTSEKEKLLKIRKWQESDAEISQFFYEVRESAKTAFTDFVLLCDTLNEKEIESIFSNNYSKTELSKMPDSMNFELMEQYYRSHPIFKDVIRYILQDRSVVSLSNVKSAKKLELFLDDSWQAYLAHDLIRICLQFFREHGFISTKAHERLAEEVEDMINVEVSRGIKLKRHERTKGFV